MKVLIDSNGLQARQHRKDAHRLCAFIAALGCRQYRVAFSSPSGLTEDQLKNCVVLVITTRSPKQFAYSQEEKEVIWDFVHKGGRLLLMTNHADWPKAKLGDTREFDAGLAKKFGVTFEQTCFRHRLARVRTIISDPDLNTGHTIIAGPPEVVSVVTNNCCSIRCDDRGEWVVQLSKDMVNKGAECEPRPDERQLFAHALEVNSGLSPKKRGRIVTIADSGFIGSDYTMKPGPGLIGQGDNLHFIMNAIDWLAGKLG